MDDTSDFFGEPSQYWREKFWFYEEEELSIYGKTYRIIIPECRHILSGWHTYGRLRDIERYIKEELNFGICSSDDAPTPVRWALRKGIYRRKIDRHIIEAERQRWKDFSIARGLPVLFGKRWQVTYFSLKEWVQLGLFPPRLRCAMCGKKEHLWCTASDGETGWRGSCKGCGKRHSDIRQFFLPPIDNTDWLDMPEVCSPQCYRRGQRKVKLLLGQQQSLKLWNKKIREVSHEQKNKSNFAHIGNT